MSRPKKKEHVMNTDSRFICKPLNSCRDIMMFLENPPPWRTLCKEMTPHSDFQIRNIEINQRSVCHSLEEPKIFCHFDPDLDEAKRYESKSLPKTLVCHDMANGYHDDSIIDGTSNSEAYTFYNWAGIDIFCYFSHHLVTIPPVGWINVGHAHGVKVIGTIITEWSEGAMFWDTVLSSEVQYKNIACALVAIAKTLKFDGYLLNVENKITEPDMLLKFVQYFYRIMHEELPHATLLWYDSVTIQGNLNWQNKLCDKNLAFFEACDGLFTNYSWSPEDVQASAELAQAAGRLTDLYIGVDVWGRNFFGGGQFNTQHAIKVVHAAGCSIALFAPAWTHEALSSESSDQNHVAMAENLDTYGMFLLRDRAFWGSIWPFLNTHLPCGIPFQTSFCRGQGRKRWLYGEMLCPSPWFNLRHQQYQPNAAHGPHGYLLTSIEHLNKVKHDVQYKDKKGIIRIRASFLQARSDLLGISSDTQAATVESVMSEVSNEGRERADPPEKSKVQALKEKFKRKPLKISEPQEESTSAREEPAPSAASSAASSADVDSMVHTPSLNLRLNRTDTARYGLAYVADERPCLQLHHDDSFSGGASLMVHPSDSMCSEHRYARLLHCDFPCDEGLIFCVVTKNVRDYPNQTLNVKLNMRNAKDHYLTVVLTDRPVTQRSPLAGTSVGIMHVYPLRTADETVLRELRTYLLLTQPGLYVPVDNHFGWRVRYYEIHVPGSRITSVNLRTGVPVGPILLGLFSIWKRTKDKGWMRFFENPTEKEVKRKMSVASTAPSPSRSFKDQCIAQ